MNVVSVWGQPQKKQKNNKKNNNTRVLTCSFINSFILINHFKTAHADQSAVQST